MTEPDRSIVRKLADESLARGDATGWFDALYQSAEGAASVIPWADGAPNPNLVAWLQSHPATELGKRALVVGCGLGDDAEALAALGMQVTAFDISPTAIAWCRERHSQSSVNYQAADLIQPPSEWTSAFDFVFEAYTLQALPLDLRAQVTRNLAGFVAPGGTLLVVARARDNHEPLGSMPWPLSPNDLAPLTTAGLESSQFEDYFDAEEPPVRRFRVTYRRAV
jgi:2-polyprenyl-3-methyl-5-hydroxy-6-metoxy-1,4-benzoquinol methylase